MRERVALVVPGPAMAVVVLLVGAAALAVLSVATTTGIVIGVVLTGSAVVLLTGFVIVAPNESKVVTFLGRYVGTVRKNGGYWTYPLTSKRTVSLRVQNFDSQVLKVNDAAGNPIEIAAVIVWKVVETARASFDVEDYVDFVKIQTETAVRHMASLYPYDSYDETGVCLRANADEITAALHHELQIHLEQAGVQVLRTQLRRLAYAPEIAADMLRRQQAEAVVAARTRIVEGAVGMVDHALSMLSAKHIVDLDEERKAAMVSNLLVVLCGEHSVRPIVNAGTLYQ